MNELYTRIQIYSIKEHSKDIVSLKGKILRTGHAQKQLVKGSSNLWIVSDIFCSKRSWLLLIAFRSVNGLSAAGLGTNKYKQTGNEAR